MQVALADSSAHSRVYAYHCSEIPGNSLCTVVLPDLLIGWERRQLLRKKAEGKGGEGGWAIPVGL